MEDRHLAYLLRDWQELRQAVQQQAVAERMQVVPVQAVARMSAVPVPDILLSVLQDCHFSYPEAEEYLR